MTRLISDWISSMEEEMSRYDTELKGKTGLCLGQLAAKAKDLDYIALKNKLDRCVAAVIPVTSGLGVIDSFSESVAAILKTIGIRVFVTDGTDVNGIDEAIRNNATILFMADDNKYIALNIKNGKCSDNNQATALGFVTALEAMAGSLYEKKVLVLGCGIVGVKAFAALKEKSAIVSVYDKNTERMSGLLADETLIDLRSLKNYKYIFDATNEGGWLKPEMLAADAYIAMPGIPSSLSDCANRIHDKRVVHDPLQIGTAVMLAEVL